jgi:hypothetical protein
MLRGDRLRRTLKSVSVLLQGDHVTSDDDLQGLLVKYGLSKRQAQAALTFRDRCRNSGYVIIPLDLYS